MELYLLIMLIVIFLLVIIFIYFSSQQNKLLEEMINKIQQEQENELNDFKYLMINELNKFKSNINESLHVSYQESNQSVNKLQTTVHSGLLKGFEQTNQAVNHMNEQLSKITTTQKHLDNLSENMQELHLILNDKTKRGLYGEIELYTILESLYGVNEKKYQKQVKLSNNKVVDAVIYGPQDHLKICIDSKFPLENYLKMYDKNYSKDEQKKAKQQFRNDLLHHINDIHNKYIITQETVPVAFMFIPSEAVFAEIYGRFEDVIERAHQKSVYIVSPTTLMAYINLVQSITLDQKRYEQVEEIQAQYLKLGQEFTRFEDRILKADRDFKRLYEDFRDVKITSKKIVKQFNDISNIEIKKEDES